MNEPNVVNREVILEQVADKGIPANSHALGVSLTPAGWKLRPHAGSRLRASFSRLIEKCEQASVAVLLDTISKNMLTQTHVRNENHV